MKGSWFDYLVYASLVFLLVALVRSDYLVMPEIHDAFSLVLSFALLFAGLWLSTESWRVTLRVGDIQANQADAIASMGLSIFTKYIPGKVWVILGRAAYIEKKYGVGKAAVSSLSLTAQLIAIWVGLLMGAIGLLWTGNLEHFNFGWPTLFLWLGFSLIIFTPWFNQLMQLMIRKFLKKEVRIPVLAFRRVVAILPVYLLQWLVWIAAFHFLCQSMVDFAVPLSTGFGFALAGTFGILAIVVPGGLGVREGLLTAYLLLLGFDKATAVSISVASRLWFLIGEFVLFIMGWAAHRKSGSGMS